MKHKIRQVGRLESLQNAIKFYKNPIPLMMLELAESGNTYSSYLGGIERTITTIDPGLIQYILQKKQRNFAKSKLQTKILARFAGRGLLTVEGDYWLQQRRLIQPGFHKEKLSSLVKIMLSVIEKRLDVLEEKLDKNKSVDISEEMMDMAFHIVANSLFSANTSENQLKTLSDNITTIQQFIIQQIRRPFLVPWFKISGQFKAADQTAEASKKILLEMIQARRLSGETHHDLLDMLLAARYEDTGEGMTDQQLIDESLIFFSAGHETSANALAWTWYLLAQHPEVVKKIKKEIDTVLGDRTPTFDDLRSLAYTMQVVRESLRLYPPAWVMDRIAVEDDEYEGITLPKNTMLLPFIYGVHRHPDLWERPNEFDPDRFEKEKMKAIPPFAYLPFGGGPRMCIGVNFAYMEMQLIIVQTLRRMELALVSDREVEVMPLITLRPRGGIWMRRK